MEISITPVFPVSTTTSFYGDDVSAPESAAIGQKYAVVAEIRKNINVPGGEI